MAEQRISIGNLEDVVVYDDTEFYQDGITPLGLLVTGTPTNDSHAVRKQDLTNSSINPLVDEQYVVMALTGDLPNERKLTAGLGITLGDGGAGGNATIATIAGIYYGATYGKDIAWVQASAAQNTWYLVSDADMVDGPLSGMTSDGNGKLTATNAGTYKIDMAISMQCSGTKKHLEYGVSIDGAAPAMYQREFFGAVSEEQHGSLTRIITVTAGQTIELAVRTPDTGTPDIEVDNLSITVEQK